MFTPLNVSKQHCTGSCRIPDDDVSIVYTHVQIMFWSGHSPSDVQLRGFCG